MSDETLKVYLLQRVYLADRTLGSIYGPNAGLICKTLELPWLDNQRGKSCIPEGLYEVHKMPPIPKDDPNTEADESGGLHYRPYWHFRLPKVKGRSGILIHIGTDVKDSQGCILVASRHIDVNTEQPKLQESGPKLKYMTDTMPDKFLLRIEKK